MVRLLRRRAPQASIRSRKRYDKRRQGDLDKGEGEGGDSAPDFGEDLPAGL